MENFKIGDIKKVKNSAGIFTIELVKIIEKDIGIPTYSLGRFEQLRIEFYEEEWLSIFDQKNPEYIYFTEIPQWNRFEPKTYKFKIVQAETSEADFVRLEAE